MLADARAAALLASTTQPTMLADARATALLASTTTPPVLADARAAGRRTPCIDDAAARARRCPSRMRFPGIHADPDFAARGSGADPLVADMFLVRWSNRSGRREGRMRTNKRWGVWEASGSTK